MSAIRLETFSDGVFAIAVTLLALQLHPPNLAEATTAGAVLHALAQQVRQPWPFHAPGGLSRRVGQRRQRTCSAFGSSPKGLTASTKQRRLGGRFAPGYR